VAPGGGLLLTGPTNRHGDAGVGVGVGVKNGGVAHRDRIAAALHTEECARESEIGPTRASAAVVGVDLLGGHVEVHTGRVDRREIHQIGKLSRLGVWIKDAPDRPGWEPVAVAEI
jgi:hypothetical protein